MKYSNSTEIDKPDDQPIKLHSFINSWDKNNLIKLDYYPKSYTKYPCVEILLESYIVELVFKYYDDENRNEIQTKFYLNTEEVSRQFVLKRILSTNHFTTFLKFRGDRYSCSVTYSNWADTIIDFVMAVEKETDSFLQLVESSCPFYKDGTHKFKEWKNQAKVEISYVKNEELKQGVKNGEMIPGSHVVGSNGSFFIRYPRTYVIKYTVDKMGCEKPIRHTYIYNADSFLRELKDRMGYSNMPYKLLNSKFPVRIEVVTRDMDKDPECRTFYPVEYNNDWIEFLKQTIGCL
jgi:hypothetical protein